jgi:hypothetical protein
MKPIEAFFREIDARWPGRQASRIRLPIIGSAALLLQTDYERGTKDGDVLRTPSLSAGAQEQLLALAGRGTRLYERHRIYLEFVASGLPFLPHVPVWHELAELNAGLGHFEVAVLDVVDVVVSKLKRFSANDRSDFSAMIERGLVPHNRLIERFVAAVDFYGDGAGGSSIRDYVANLHRVEADEYGVEPTLIELPRWLDEE